MPARTGVRYAVVVLCGVIAGGRAVDLVQILTALRRGAVHPAPQALQRLALVDAVIVIVSLVIAALVWSLLRPLPAPATEARDRR